MKKYSNLEHFNNSLITLTIVGIGVTFLVQTKRAEQYRDWFKTYFIPTTKKLLKEVLKDESVVEYIKKYQNISTDAVSKRLGLGSEAKKLLKTTTKKGVDKVIKKIKEDESKV